MTDLVTLEIDEHHVARVSLNRPERMNALTPDLFHALIAMGEQLHVDARVRAVVLHGNGRAFCAGLDLSNFDNINDPDSFIAPGKLAPRSHGLANIFQRTALVWHDLKVPVIAALHGVAYGGGLQLALGADMRYVAADTRLSMMEMRWGLVPDMAGVWLTSKLMRDDQARELIYTGRVLDGHEAVAIGLATRVCADPLAEALARARDIAGFSPTAIQAAKRLLNQAATEDMATVLLAEALEQDKLLGSAEQSEAVLANREKRQPRF